ncbi:hypothetical protein [Streptomyces puniciscabiei]|uniref:hypothetical protein n=1 Tax=Streptomyces puniciscabiei TaxID=164348 RepID=UPI00332B1DF1
MKERGPTGRHRLRRPGVGLAFSVRSLTRDTWPGFARLVAEHDGVWGGTVESFPQDTEGTRVSASFLHNGTVALFESRGFTRARRLGKNHWVVTRTVRPAA